MKRIVISAEKWPINTLISCLEGDANLGEVYLEFQAPRKPKEILRIIVIDDTERKYIIKAFNDIVQALDSHPHIIYDTCLNAEKIAAAGEEGLYDVNSPAVLDSTANKASFSPVTPQKMERTPPGLGGFTGGGGVNDSNNGGNLTPGGSNSKSPLLRSPIKTPKGTAGSLGQASAAQVAASGSPLYGNTGPNTDGKRAKGSTAGPIFDLNTNFHLFSNKDLVAAVKAERLEDKARGHRERQELIKILEAHYRRIGRALAKQPIVSVKSDFEQQLRDIYEHYNPDKIKDIPMIMEHFKGQEEHLLEQLHLKYDIQEANHHLIGAIN